MDIFKRPNYSQPGREIDSTALSSSQVSPATILPLSQNEKFLSDRIEEIGQAVLSQRVEHSVTDAYLRRHYGDLLSGCPIKIFEPQYPVGAETSEATPALPRDDDICERTLHQVLNSTVIRLYSEVFRSGHLLRSHEQLQGKVDRAFNRNEQVLRDESLRISYKGQGMLYRNLPDATIELYVTTLLNQAHSAIQQRQLDQAEDLVRKALIATKNLDYGPITGRCFAWLYVINQLRRETRAAAAAFLSALPCIGKYIEGRLLRVNVTPEWEQFVREHAETNGLSLWSEFSKEEAIAYLDKGLQGNLTSEKPLSMDWELELLDQAMRPLKVTESGPASLGTGTSGDEDAFSSEDSTVLNYGSKNDDIGHSADSTFGARKLMKPPPLDLSSGRGHQDSQPPISSPMSTNYRERLEELSRPTVATPDAENLSEPPSTTLARHISPPAESGYESSHDPERHRLSDFIAQMLIYSSTNSRRRKPGSVVRPRVTEVELRQMKARHRENRNMRIMRAVVQMKSTGLDYSAIVETVHQTELSELRDWTRQDIDDPYKQDYQALIAEAKERDQKSHSSSESTSNSGSSSSRSSISPSALRPPPLLTKAHRRNSEAEVILSDTPAVVSSEAENESSISAIHLGGVRGGYARKASIVESPTLSSPSPLRETTTLEELLSREEDEGWDLQSEDVFGQ